MDESLHGDERSLRGSSIILGKPAVRRDSAASCLDMTTPARCSHPSSFLDVPSSSFTLGRTFGQVVTNAQPPSLSDSTARKNNSPPPPVRHCIHEVRQSFCQDLPPSLLARPLPPQCASSVVDKGDVSLNRGEARRGSQRALGNVEPVLVHGGAQLAPREVTTSDVPEIESMFNTRDEDDSEVEDGRLAKAFADRVGDFQRAAAARDAALRQASHALEIRNARQLEHDRSALASEFFVADDDIEALLSLGPSSAVQ